MSGRGRGLVAAAIAAVVVASAAAMPSGAAAADERAPGPPVSLRVDEASSPLWVTGAPEFAWIPTDPDRGETQSAYRILVSTTATTDPGSARVVFDSGRVASHDEAYVTARGLHLEPDHRYWWTVQTWDGSGRAGPFARPVPFDTALGDGDWHADWIKRAGAPMAPWEDYSLYRHAFAVSSSPVVRARAYVSASQQYALYVDGARVDGGPSYAYPDEQYYQVTDITKDLHPGARNAVAMIVHNLGGGQGRPEAPPGLIAHLTVDHADGTRDVITTDGSWRVHTGPWVPSTARNGEGDYVESIDARLLPTGWADASFDDSSWARAAVIGAHPVRPWTDLVAQRTRVVETAVHPVKFTKLADGSYVADFGAVIAATTTVHLHTGVAGRTITLRQGYLLDPDGSVSTKIGTQDTDMHDDYVERAGDQTFRPFSYLGLRYVEVVGAAEPLTASDVVAYARHAEMPDLQASTFSSSSTILDRIWALADHSALYGSQEQFVDTPTRERGQFLLDASDISSTTTVAFGERNLTWQALRDFARSQSRYWPDGRVNAVYPNGDGKRDIPDLTEDYVGWVLREYELTGDRVTLAQLYPVITNIATYVANAIVAQVGLVANLPGGGGDYAGGIVDWPIQMRYGYDMTTLARTTENVLAIEVFREVAAAARALHRPAAEVRAQETRATALTKAVNDRLRRADGVYVDGLHQDGSQSTHASQQANAYALAAGIVPAASRGVVVKQVERLGMATGPDIATVLLDALHESGNDQALVDLVSNPKVPGWAQTLARGATYTWESWDARDVYGDSESHAWGSAVLPVLSADILGVRVTAPGASTVSVTPPRTSVTSAKGRLATERGAVSVAWHRVDATHFSMQLTVPDNVVASVELPAASLRDVREGSTKLTRAAGVSAASVVAAGSVRFTAGSGHYSFTVAPAPPAAGHTGLLVAIVVVVAGLVLLAGAFLFRRKRRPRPVA